MQIKGILTPIIRKEMPDLLRWIRYCPPPISLEKIGGITWYLSIDSRWHNSETKLITRHVLNSNLSGIALDFISLDMPARESVYFRSLPPTAECDLPYGSKSGPNLQFFMSIKYLCNKIQAANKGAVVLLETDAIPVKNYWIMMLDSVIAKLPEFWLAGSRYKGKSILSPAIQGHINGNAIYGIGASGFLEFLETWERVLLHCVKKRHWIAYDVALDWFSYYSSCLNLTIVQDDLDILRQYLGRVQDVSDAIINVSGEHEAACQSFDDYHLLTPEAVVIHSRPLSKIIDWCNGDKGLNIAALQAKHPLCKRQAALGSSFLSYLNVDDPATFCYDLLDYYLANRRFTEQQDVITLAKACLCSGDLQ